MFVTPYGNFDGNSWEKMFQILFKKKFMAVNYQRVKASPGDFGIEGYTKDGQTFQCYCPDINMGDSILYEKQRDKITADIGKLNSNKNELYQILGGVKLKKWVLVTPHIGHRDLLVHCIKKREMVKSWGLPFIDETEFEILIHEADDYAIEIGEYFDQTGKKFSINPKHGDSTSEKIIEWQRSEIDLVKNALGKNIIRINSLPNSQNVETRANKLTDETARFFLNGESILRTWQSSQPENHQRFIELLASVEDELREKCLLNIVEPNTFVSDIAIYMDKKIRNAFHFLDESTIVRLKNYSIAFWLLRCPLYFETSE